MTDRQMYAVNVTTRAGVFTVTQTGAGLVDIVCRGTGSQLMDVEDARRLARSLQSAADAEVDLLLRKLGVGQAGAA